jgi:hypothetical protein
MPDKNNHVGPMMIIKKKETLAMIRLPNPGVIQQCGQ